MHSIQVQERRSFADPRDFRATIPKADDGSRDEALALWMESEGRARILVDDDLRARWVSASAAALMSRANSLLIRNGHIHTRENRFERQLRDFVAGATSTVSMRCFHDPSTCEHLVLTALRLSAPFNHIVGITMRPASAGYTFLIADLHDAFGFTQTEARVAYDLLCGHTAEQTARILHVGLETVRTHIKRIYVKLGVSSREAFFYRLAPFMLAA